MSKKIFQKPRGTRDILKEEMAYFDYLTGLFSSEAKRTGFSKIETPIFEDTNLFVRSVGKDTDIVEKEMYTFSDRSGNSITLRPEGTAPVARAYLEQGMQSLPKPVGLYYYGPMFRYERPQSGRFRQFFTWSLEVIGSDSSLIDATLISMLWRNLEVVGLKDLSLNINSIGCTHCRTKFKKSFSRFISDVEKKLCEDCIRRSKTNPLRILDCKQKKCQGALEEAPVLVNNLCKECFDHFKEVLEWLDELDIPYDINTKLVRGLDYYNKTVFEIWSKKDQGQCTLGAGGRYDGLIELLGGKKTPAVGFGVGIDRVVAEMRNQGIEIAEDDKLDIFVAQLGDFAKKKGFKLLYDLKKEGLSASGTLDNKGISDQLKLASTLKVYFTLIIGQKEAMSDTVIIKDMQSGSQETYPIDKVVKEVRKRIAGYNS